MAIRHTIVGSAFMGSGPPERWRDASKTQCAVGAILANDVLVGVCQRFGPWNGHSSGAAGSRRGALLGHGPS